MPSDYYKIDAVFLYGATGSQYRLLPISRQDRDATQSTGTPVFYYVSGGNVSGSNSYSIGLNPIPSSSGTNDLIIYIRQLPADMVSGGQAPEVIQPWQDALVSYAVWKCYRRRGKDWIAMAQSAQQEWMTWLQKAKRYVNPLMRDLPYQVYDNGGYMSFWE